jgi:hypothetical protein
VDGLWPWLALAGLGAFHGLNPAMGWLFAVALGMHRRSRRAVVLAILPIALGHALAVGIVIALFLVAGLVLDQRVIRWFGAAILVGWAVYHAIYGHRGRVRFGMQVSLVGLFAWSFLMATAHGAGLMLLPVLIPLSLGSGPAAELTASGSMPIALAALGVHTAAMLIVTGTVALVVYEIAGLDFLRRGWLNLDIVWTVVLIAAAALLVIL